MAEPSFEVIYKHPSALSYEIRRYGQRFAAQVSYNDLMKEADGDKKEGEDPNRSPFSVLAKYIGVFGTPENESQQSISMTAPVVKDGQGEPVKIAMTAPVVMDNKHNKASQNGMTMAFILPAEYDSITKIPKPTNPAVHIKELPPAVGAVHVYSGSHSDELCGGKAEALAAQLRSDGLEEITNEYALERYQFWGYNPPFTLPMFRRNEVWIELTENQVKQLVNGMDSQNPN